MPTSMKPPPPTTPHTVPKIRVRVTLPGEHNGTIAWLAPGDYRMVYTIETNQTLVVPEDCISDVNDAPSFDSNDTDITFFKPAVARAIAVAPKQEAARVAPKKQAAPKRQAAPDTASAAAPEKKAVEAPKTKETQDPTPPHKFTRPPSGAHQIMRGTHRALKS